MSLDLFGGVKIIQVERGTEIVDRQTGKVIIVDDQTSASTGTAQSSVQ